MPPDPGSASPSSLQLPTDHVGRLREPKPRSWASVSRRGFLKDPTCEARSFSSEPGVSVAGSSAMCQRGNSRHSRDPRPVGGGGWSASRPLRWMPEGRVAARAAEILRRIIWRAGDQVAAQAGLWPTEHGAPARRRQGRGSTGRGTAWAPLGTACGTARRELKIAADYSPPLLDVKIACSVSSHLAAQRHRQPVAK